MSLRSVLSGACLWLRWRQTLKLLILLTWDIFPDRTELGEGRFKKTVSTSESLPRDVRNVFLTCVPNVTVEDSQLFHRALKRTCWIPGLSLDCNILAHHGRSCGELPCTVSFSLLIHPQNHFLIVFLNHPYIDTQLCWFMYRHVSVPYLNSKPLSHPKNCLSLIGDSLKPHPCHHLTSVTHGMWEPRWRTVGCWNLSTLLFWCCKY